MLISLLLLLDIKQNVFLLLLDCFSAQQYLIVEVSGHLRAHF